MQYAVTETAGGTTVEITGGLCLCVNDHESEWIMPDNERWRREERTLESRQPLDADERFLRAVIVARLVARRRQDQMLTDLLKELGYAPLS